MSLGFIMQATGVIT